MQHTCRRGGPRPTSWRGVAVELAAALKSARARPGRRAGRRGDRAKPGHRPPRTPHGRAETACDRERASPTLGGHCPSIARSTSGAMNRRARPGPGTSRRIAASISLSTVWLAHR